MPWEKPPDASYLPDATPFRLPVAIRRVKCVFAEPLPASRIAHNMTSSLLGALRSRTQELVTAGALESEWLYKPQSQALKDRAFPPSVAWSTEHLSERTCIGLLILWGRHVVAEEEVVWSMLEQVARDGVHLEGVDRTFTLEPSAWFRGTCGQWLESFPVLPNELIVTTQAATSADLASLCADAAIQLFYWDLVDSGLVDAIGRATMDRLAVSLNREIHHAFCGLQVDRTVTGPITERRYSGTNRGSFTVTRWDSVHVVRAESPQALHAAWSWIALMCLRGPGPRRQFGLSEGRVFLPEEIDRLPVQS